MHVLGRVDRIAQSEETPSVEESGGQELTRQVRGLKGKMTSGGTGPGFAIYIILCAIFD